MNRHLLLALILALSLPVLAVCGGGATSATSTPPAMPAAQAEAWLARVVLAPGDVGQGYTADVLGGASVNRPGYPDRVNRHGLDALILGLAHGPKPAYPSTPVALLFDN